MPLQADLSRRRLKSTAGHSQRGFTLVELLIAMTLVGMMMVILFGGLRLSTRSWEAAEEKLVAVEKLRVVEGLFRRQIREQKLLFYEDPERGPVVTFAGTPQAIRFVVPLLERLGLGGLYWVTFEAVRKGSESDLMMSWWPYRPGTQNMEAGGREQEVVLEAVEEVTFSYFGREAMGQAPQWYERWENPQQPPQLVRLQIRTKDAEWPELIVGIRSEPQVARGAVSRRLRLDFGAGSPAAPGAAEPIPE